MKIYILLLLVLSFFFFFWKKKTYIIDIKLSTFQHDMLTRYEFVRFFESLYLRISTLKNLMD